jgi:hypothetical protein
VKPVAMTYRNLSLDSLIDVINSTRGELAKLQESPMLSAEDRNKFLALVQQMKEAFYQIADLCIPK